MGRVHRAMIQRITRRNQNRSCVPLLWLRGQMLHHARSRGQQRPSSLGFVYESTHQDVCGPFCSDSQQRDVFRIRSKLDRPQYKWPLNWQDFWKPIFLSQKNINIPVSFFFFQTTHIRSWYWESVSTAPGQRQLCMASRTTRIQLYESTRWMTMAKLLCRSGNHPVA